MFDKLEVFEQKYEELNARLYDPDVVSDQETYKALMKEHKNLTPIVEAYRSYRKARETVEESKQLLSEGGLDRELKELAEAELGEAEAEIDRLTEEIKILLLPRDPNDDRNVIVEIRGGAGGEEAALFSAVLFRMYSMYAESKGWKVEVVGANETELGGYKEISFMITGEGAYSRLKYESGVHRVQRVPETETQGRIHTSAATVAVLPEAEEVDVQIAPNDIRIDVFHASGHGGQSVNTTDSAVRITHLPTGMIVTCQDEKSQLKNKEKAMKVLYSRLYELTKQAADAEHAKNRRDQIGSGDRSERIRTYNFPQGRVTDHRIGLTIYRLEAFLDGDMDEVIEALIYADKEAYLKEVQE